MIQKILFLAIALMSGISTLHGQAPRYDWDRAESEIQRLKPSEFPELPEVLVAELQSRGCTIPQLGYPSPHSHNVIHGEFAVKGRKDWVVLCSKNRVSSILIFWGGSPENTSEIAEFQDHIFLQGQGNGQIFYSRALGVAGQEYILDHYKKYIGPNPPPIDHEGINDMFVEKASTVHYYNQGKWFKVPGSD